jgi:5-methylcytosine-specific restriction endonuclease McrA
MLELIDKEPKRPTRDASIKIINGEAILDEPDDPLEEMLAYFEYKCAYCDIDLSELDWKYHKDHIVPIAKDGTNGIANRAPVCQECNAQKGTKDWAT